MPGPRSPQALAALVLALIVASASAPAPARAQDDDDPERGPIAALPSDPVFTATLIDATTLTGRLKQLGPNAEVVLVPARGAERAVPLARVVKLTREDAEPLPATPEEPVVLLPDGERLRAVIESAGETALKARSYAVGDIAIPLQNVLGLVFKLPPEADEAEDLLARVRAGQRGKEVVWMANGDRLAGGFLGLGPDALQFQPEGGRQGVPIGRGQVVALAFDPGLVDYPRPEGTYLELSLADGSRLGVTGARIEQGQLAATARFGAAVRVPLGDLARVHVLGGPVAYLSGRDPAAEQSVAYLGPTRPYRRDANVEGYALRLGGTPYHRGLGTQSRTLLAYALRPGDKRFQALVGVDDRAGPEGSVVFRVRLDGKEKFRTPPLSARDTPQAIDLDVAGAKFLILESDFGERGNVRDFADWVEARIIR